MNLEWFKSHKVIVAVFGAATVGYVLYSYMHKSSNGSATATAGSPQYLVPVIQSGVAPNPTSTTPSSNTPTPNLPPVLSTPTNGASASVQLGAAPNFTSPVPTAPIPGAIATATSPGQGYNVQTGVVQPYTLTGGGTSAGGLVLGPAASLGYNSGNTGGTPYVYEGGMLVTRDASGF